MEHVPVLPDETVRALVQNPSGLYVDGTFGRGGHARLLLDALDTSGRLIALDADEEAFRAASALAQADPRVQPARARFSELGRHMPAGEGADGVMLDVGVSSPQLDDAARGFSFSHDGPLDMRMDQRRDMTAADWLGSASEGDIADVLRRFGEERHARRIAHRIALERPLRTTGELRDVVMRASPMRGRDALRQTATRVFQAIRIHINDELAELDRGLDAALEALHPGGRLAVISFHSLEHRMVRQRFRDWQQGPPTPRRLPVPPEFSPLAKAVGKGIRPNATEIAANPRSRSALLQVAEKLAPADTGSDSSKGNAKALRRPPLRETRGRPSRLPREGGVTGAGSQPGECVALAMGLSGGRASRPPSRPQGPAKAPGRPPLRETRGRVSRLPREGGVTGGGGSQPGECVALAMGLSGGRASRPPSRPQGRAKASA